MSSESMRLKGNPKSGRPLFNRTPNQILKNPLNARKFIYCTVQDIIFAYHVLLLQDTLKYLCDMYISSGY